MALGFHRGSSATATFARFAIALQTRLPMTGRRAFRLLKRPSIHRQCDRQLNGTLSSQAKVHWDSFLGMVPRMGISLELSMDHSAGSAMGN